MSEIKEFVEIGGCIYRSGYSVVDVEISAKLKCKCGKESCVKLGIDYDRDCYAGSGDIILEVKCPHCNARYEKTNIKDEL